jgi:hypothetical protein
MRIIYPKSFLVFNRMVLMLHNKRRSTKPKYGSLQSVHSTGHDIRSRDVHTHGMAGPQVHGRSANYGKSYARGFSAGSNPKPGDPTEN